MLLNTVQQNPVTLRDSHPLVDDSSGVNWTIKLNWICHCVTKIIQNHQKKSTFFFPNPSLHLFVFASEWPLESIHRCPAQCFDISGCTTFFVSTFEAFNHATRRHGSFSFFHVWKKYHGDEFRNRCPFCCFRHNLCYLILLKASSQWGGHPILGFLLDTLW